jgi:hypothetical protein
VMTRLLKWIFRTGNRIGISKDRELSKHRVHSTKYQDLCM